MKVAHPAFFFIVFLTKTIYYITIFLLNTMKRKMYSKLLYNRFFVSDKSVFATKYSAIDNQVENVFLFY